MAERDKRLVIDEVREWVCDIYVIIREKMNFLK